MADEEKAEQQDKKPEKGSKNLLIIGLLAGLLLGGGGGFGAFMMMGSGENHETSEEEPVVEEPEAELELHFVKVEHVTIPLVHNRRLLGNMMMDFSLEVEGNENKMAVIQNLPEIRDAILRHYSDTPLGKKDSPQTVDYPRLKKTIKDISNRILHEPVVRRVMVVQVRRF